MKTKVIVLLAVSAIVTLSFTFASATKPEPDKKAESVTTEKQANSEPAGGFVSEDKF